MERRLAALAAVEAVIIVVLTILVLSRPSTDTPAPAGGLTSKPETSSGVALAATSDAPAPPPTEAPAKPPVREEVLGAAGDDDPIGTVLYGRLLGEDGEPVPQAYLWLSRPNQSGSISCSYHKERGYAFPPVEPGHWRLKGRAEGYRDLATEIDLDGTAQRRDLVFGRAFLIKVAVVTPDGLPIRKALAAQKMYRCELAAIATADDPPETFPMTTRRTVTGLGVGKWRGVRFGNGPKLPERFLGVFELEAPPPVWISIVHRHVIVAKKLVQPGEDEVEVVLPIDGITKTFGGATLQVVDSQTGAPLTKARVEFSDRQSGGAGVKVDENGRVSFDQLPPGILEMTVRAPETEVYHCMMRIHPGVIQDLGTVAIDPATEIGGTVVGSDGKPVANASIRWFRLGRTAADLPLDNGFSARSDTEGAFVLFGSGRGRYLIVASVRGSGVGSTVVDSSAGPVDDVRISLAPSQIEIVNQIPKTTTYLLILRAPEGHAVYSRHLRPGPSYPVQVPPGRYVAEIRSDTKIVRSFNVEVGGAKPARIVVP